MASEEMKKAHDIEPEEFKEEKVANPEDNVQNLEPAAADKAVQAADKGENPMQKAGGKATDTLHKVKDTVTGNK